MRGFENRHFEGTGRPRRPIALRIFHLLIGVSSVAVLGFAVWIGARTQQPPSAAVAALTTTTTTSTTTATTTANANPATTTASPTSAQASPSSEVVLPTTTAAAPTRTPTSVPTTTATPAAPGVASAKLLQSAPMAATPGDAGLTLSRDDIVGITGNVSVVNGSTWFEVTRGTDMGWTPAIALGFNSSGFERRPCGAIPDEIPPTPLAYQPGTAEGSADSVAAIEHHQSDGCSRLVLYLANGVSTGEAILASAFPEGLSIVDLGGRIRIELPQDITVAPELSQAMVVVDGGDALVMSALRPDGRTVFNIDPGPARVSVSFLARPARVVIDLVRESDSIAAVGQGVVINAHSIADAAAAGDGRVMTISGYARLLDGLGEIAFRRAPADGAEPASGFAYDAIFDGTTRAGAVLRSWYFYETPRFDGAWAEFQFTVAGLVPGSYEMFLGLGSNSPDDIAEPGLFQIFTVEEPG